MVPSGLAMMDSSGDSRDVRTSTQTFMTRNGSPQIRALEERAHNLTRLPYELGENIQVVRYEKGQKYGAHRDFFNPNDYHKQPAMLRNVEYGARNRMATVFWYLETVKEGGETFFPRALNADGREYHPWNGDHEDCYRGLYVPPVRGNAVLFYSMVPDGRLDERALHGGCKPRVEGHEKWGANQWIWNHPERHSGVAPRKGAAGSRHAQAKGGRAGCVDSEENCPAWADGGECEKSATAASRTPKSPHTIASVL
jgi:prolyl 4-hydroxylase